MLTRPVYPAHEAQIVAPSAGLLSGDVLSHAVLGPCIVEGLNVPSAIGDLINVRHSKGPTIAGAAASGLTASAGDTMEWDDGTDTVVANTAGDFDIGLLLVDKASGETECLIVLGAA